MNRHTSEDSFAKRSHNLVVVLYFTAYEAAESTAILFTYNNVVSHIDQTTGKITGVGSFQSGVGKTLTGTVGRDKVFQHRQTFLEVRQNRVLDNLATFSSGLLRFRHKTTHTGQLTNLVLRTTGTRIKHHEHRVETLVSLGHLLHKHVGKTRIHMRPDIDNLVVAFVVGDETHRIVVHHFLNLLVTLLHNLLLFRRDDNVTEVERQTATECHVVTHVLDVVKELGRTGDTAFLDNLADDVTQRFLGNQLVHIADFLGDELIEEYTANRSVLDKTTHGIALLVNIINHHAYRGMKCYTTFVIGNLCLFGSVEFRAFTFRTLAELCDIVKTEHHVLRRDGDRRAIGGVKDVMRTEHKHLSFQDSLVAKGKVHSHLVAVEVGIECRTSQRMELDSLAFDHFRLESLDTETVKRRGTVKKNRVPFHHIFKDIPYNWFLTVDNLLCRFYRLHNAALNELADYERLVKLGRHIFGDTAFVHLQFRAYDDNRTCGIVDTLTEKVLTETALLTF